jgi:hypothetical protein
MQTENPESFIEAQTNKPVILIVTTLGWVATARMATALADAGCHVEALCPPAHPLSKTRAVRRIHPYSGLLPLRSLSYAIKIAHPDLILPGDDLATRHLHHLYVREQTHGRTGSRTSKLIVCSLGSADSFSQVYARTATMKLARAEGVRVPDTEVVANVTDLQNCVSRMGLPLVLKSNASSGGDGVRIVHSLQEAQRAFRALQAPPSLARVLKRAALHHDRTLAWPWLFRQRSAVNAQAYVPGHEATSLVACWHGKVLAGMNFEVLKKWHSLGPATVLRRIDNQEMSTAATALVARLKLSGMVGFDFMLEERTGNAYLIEINPRTTQVGHLTLGPGRDLPAALVSILSGNALQEAPALTENDTIALFPQEWKRDPKSQYLLSAYQDVPWDEPELVRSCLRQPRKKLDSLSPEALFKGLSKNL